jgi:hypothetical protein
VAASHYGQQFILFEVAVSTSHLKLSPRPSPLAVLKNYQFWLFVRGADSGVSPDRLLSNLANPLAKRQLMLQRIPSSQLDPPKPRASW